MGKKITISILGNRDFYMELFFELPQAALGTGFNTLTMGDAPLMGSVTDDAQVIAGFQAQADLVALNGLDDGTDSDMHTFAGRCGMREADMGADAYIILGEMNINGMDGRFDGHVEKPGRSQQILEPA